MERAGKLKALALIALLAAGVSAQPKRKALVVGNGDYQNLPRLTSSPESARAFAQMLGANKFTVALKINVDADGLLREIRQFLQDVVPGDVAVFYFSGYAVQEIGENYLLPVGFKLRTEDGIEFHSYSLKRLVRLLEAKKLSAGMVVLDTEHTDPGIEKRFSDRGLAAIELRGQDFVVAMSNLPGRSARDNGANISRYTRAWQEAMAEPWLPLDAILRKVKQRVSATSGGEQVPSEVSTMVKEFIFDPKSPATIEWEKLTNSRDAAALESFRARYPSDPNAAEAADRIRGIEWGAAASENTRASIDRFLRKYPGDSAARAWIAKADAAERAGAEAAVLAAVERFRRANESRNIDELIAIRPSLAPERRRLEQSFRTIRSMKYELSPSGAPVIGAAAATVKCRLRVETKMDGGTPPPVDKNVTVKLRRQGDGWIIESVD